MRLVFPVEVTVDIADQAVALALGIEVSELQEAVKAGELDQLAIGQFGDLRLVPGTEEPGMLGHVVSYTTGPEVYPA